MRRCDRRFRRCCRCCCRCCRTLAARRSDTLPSARSRSCCALRAAPPTAGVAARRSRCSTLTSASTARGDCPATSRTRPRRIRRRRTGRRQLAIGSDARASTSIRTTAATTRRPPATTTAVSTAATLTKGARCSRAEGARKGRRAPQPTSTRARPSCSPHCSRCSVPSKRPPRALSSSEPSGCSARPTRGSSPMPPPSRRRSRRRRPLRRGGGWWRGAGGRGGSGGGSSGGGGSRGGARWWVT